MLECGRVFINIEDPVEFMLSDDPSIPEGLEKGIESMKSGEKAKFVMDPSLGFGELGLEESGVPSNAKLTYEVTLHSFEMVLLQSIVLSSGLPILCLQQYRERILGNSHRARKLLKPTVSKASQIVSMRYVGFHQSSGFETIPHNHYLCLKVS